MAGGGEDSFIVPLGLLLGSTALVALLLSYAKQSTIVAFISVGVAVTSFGVEVDTGTLDHISEVGILILLFMAGLEVELEAFITKWKTVTIIGLGQIVCSTGFFALSSLIVLPVVGAEVTTAAAVYFGLCMCFSSTILVLGYLKSSKSMGTVYGQLCLGTLVLQDAASVLGIAALSGLTGDGNIAVSILVLFGKLIATCFICYLLERYVLNKMFEAFARSLELLYLGALGYATGLAAIAVTAGFSGEITAFLAGVSIAQLPYKMHIETKMEPIKSLGVAIFFITLGLKLELNQEFVESLPVGFGLAVFTLFATLPLFMGLGVLARLKAHNVFMLGLLMNQISEFSLILCTLCVRANVLEPVILTVMTVAAVVSIIISSIGHTFIDAIYRKMQRWTCLLWVDAHYRRGFAQNAQNQENAKDARESTKSPPTVDTGNDESAESDPSPTLLHVRPSTSMEVEDWAFEDQLKDRPIEQLEIDLKTTRKELEDARESMAATMDEKRSHFDEMKSQLYGVAGSKSGKSVSRRGSIIMTSHASDIMHGMIEGYVILDHQLLFCTLRAGRMLFWKDQHDVGHAPPTSVWDISGMAILKAETEEMRVSTRRMSSLPSSPRKSALESERSPDHFSDSDSDDDDEEAHPWEWTIVMGHIHRHTGTSSIEDDTMKLVIHGLEDHSDHDAQDWQDALSVATSMLNPIALRLAHIREELHSRRNTKGALSREGFVEGRKAAHSHRNEIICIGYNEMFPAVLALADAIHKDVVVVEYDPTKINTVKGLYNEEKRKQDLKDKRSGKNTQKAVKGAADDMDLSSVSSRGRNKRTGRDRRLRAVTASAAVPGYAGFFERPSQQVTEKQLKGVSCEYADIHDPECWEELEMDKAFMLVCTMKGARHAEKAIMKWLRKHKSDTIFIACTQNNVEAIQLYQAGAHFVMQTDALAMRSTREIFMESVANVGDCSQLIAAGVAHRRRLIKLQSEDGLKFQYETG